MESYFFIGGVVFEEHERKLKNIYNSIPFFSSDALQKDIIHGICENTKRKVNVFNLIFYPSTKKVFWSSRGERKFEYGNVYDLPFLYAKIVQHFSKALSLYLYLRKNLPSEKTHIVVYSAYFPFLLALALLKNNNKFSFNTCLIVADLPQYMGLDSNQGLYRKISRIVSDWIFKKSKNCVDSYVFLTEHMNSIINSENKPYIVMEGIATKEYPSNLVLTNVAKKRVLYSGTLQFKYGIKILLEAIQKISNTEIEFIFYGIGEGRNKIIEQSKIDSRIIYREPIPRRLLYIEQQKSTVLINPRQNLYEFTKYSFPSKNIEYMLSGRPVIGYKLDGIPEDYYEFLICPSDNSPQTLADLIMDTLNKNESELNDIGLKAREFIMQNKNYQIQTKRIIELIEKSSEKH